MKTKMSVAVLAGLIAIISGCSTHWGPATQLGLTTTVRVSGTPGALVVGHYVCQGERTGFTNSLPFACTQTGLTELVVRKVRGKDALSVTACGGGAEVTSTAPPGTPGLRVLVHKGVEIQTLSK
jgi:hypothetical protein